jgi:hypothetical protein
LKKRLFDDEPCSSTRQIARKTRQRYGIEAPSCDHLDGMYVECIHSSFLRGVCRVYTLGTLGIRHKKNLFLDILVLWNRYISFIGIWPYTSHHYLINIIRFLIFTAALYTCIRTLCKRGKISALGQVISYKPMFCGTATSNLCLLIKSGDVAWLYSVLVLRYVIGVWTTTN